MKNFFHLLFFIFLAVFVNSCQEKVDLIVHNASVYTLGDIEGRVTAFVVDEGKFIDVGGDELINNYDARKVLDLQKLPVYPGFIDSHCHFIKLGLSLQQVDLKGTRSFEEVLNRVQDYSKNKDLRVITGRGWDQNDWKDKSLPNKSKLDSLFPDIPVALRRIDGHALLVNQKALDMAGINEKTKIKGGTIIKNNGRLTGVLVDSPISLVTSILPKPSLSEKIKALKNAEKIAFENGLTTVSVAGIDKDEIYLIDSLQKTGEIQIRVYAMISNNKDNMDHFLSNGPIRKDKLNVRSFKVYADGALGSRGAALKAPYSDLKSHRGEFITPKDSLEKLAYMLSKTPFQMNTHAIGDDANRTILEAYNKALIFSNDPRWRIEHAQVIDTADISLFNRKIIPSVQPTHATSDMYWAEERIGSSRLDGAYAYKKLLDMSGRISLGTDFPVEEVSPLLTFFAAVARQDKNLYPEGGYLSENKLSRMEALSGMTEWGAYANFEEDQKGSIEVGKVADFIILDRDIILEKESNILKTRIVATLLNGNIVYSNRIN
jgi:predicted amidohydrolase YtcJ